MVDNKRHKYISRILLILIALFLIIDFAGGPVLERIIKHKLSSYINDTPDRLYDIFISEIHISISKRAVRLSDVNIHPRTIALDSLKANKIAMLISFKADRLFFNGFSFLKLILFNRINLSELSVISPSAVIYINPKGEQRAKESGVATNTFNQKLKDASIKKLNIKNTNLSVIQLTAKDTLYFKLSNSSIYAENISVFPREESNIDKVKYRSMQFYSGGIYAGFIKNYTLKADSIKMDSEDRSLVIDNFSYKPKHFNLQDTAIQFMHDVFIVSTDKISLKGINLHGHNNVKGLYAHNISLNNLDLWVSTNRRLPKNMNRKPLIGELIKKISLPIGVDTIQLSKSRITYRELDRSYNSPLKVFFAKTDLTLTNFTNELKRIKEQPNLNIKAKTLFLGAGRLNFNLTVPLNAKENQMIVSGHLGQIPIAPVNKMLEGPVSVRFATGKINSLDLNFVAKEMHSKGKLFFDYNDLTIHIFKDKQTVNKGIKEKNKWLINAVANGIIKKKNNNMLSDKITTGIIDYERTKDISIPGYLFKSIKSGLISTFKPGTRRKAVKKDNQEEREMKNEIKQDVKNEKNNSKQNKKLLFKKKGGNSGSN